MKSTQLLSVVFSLIMFTGVTAGNAVFADSHELDDQLEDYCEMTETQKSDFLAENDLSDLTAELDDICAIDNEDEREDELDMLIDELGLDDETDETNEEDIDDFEDCVEAGGEITDNANECTIDGVVFTEDDDDDTDDVIDSFEDCVEAGYPVMESYPEQCMTDDGTVFVNDEDDDDYDNDRDDRHDDLEDRLERFCEMTDEEKDRFFADHPRIAQFEDRLENHCDLSEDEREDAIDKFIATHFPGLDSDKVLVCHKGKNTLSIAEDALRAHLAHGDEKGPCEGDSRADYLSDKYSNKGTGNLRDRLAMFCDMTLEKREAKIAENHPDLSEELREELLGYCDLSEDEQDDFRDSMKDRMDMLHDYAKDKMHDKITDHRNYEQLCKLSESELAEKVTDVAKLDRISDWCEMTPEEREDYKKEHRDEMKEKIYDKMEKFSDKSDRLKAMIMDKRDISDERRDEIKMKFESKFGEDSDKKRSEIKMKYKDHMLKMKFKMSDERRSDVHDRLAEMKAYKAELREKSSELSDEEKQQLREEFIEKAKDMQLAWISPRTQMTAGVDSAEVECREGYSLVMKASNGVAMCLKADTALKMIDRGIVVPAN